MTANTIATVQGSKVDSSELYLLLDTGCSDSIIRNNYSNLCLNIERDLMKTLGIIIDFKHRALRWININKN